MVIVVLIFNCGSSRGLVDLISMTAMVEGRRVGQESIVGCAQPAADIGVMACRC